MLSDELECIAAKAFHVSEMSALAIQTFQETYAAFNTKEDMDAYCNNYFNPEAIKSELKNKNNFVYLIQQNSEFVAYAFLKIQRCKIKVVPNPSLEIHRIYVLKKYQGKRIGMFLMHQIMEFAKQRRRKSIWLGVWKKNLNAISFYNQFGFQICGNTTFILGSDLQEDYLMYVEL